MVGTVWRDAFRGRPENLHGAGSGPAALALGNLRPDELSRKTSLDKDDSVLRAGKSAPSGYDAGDL